MTGFPLLHQLTEFAQTHVHHVSDAIQPSHPLSSLSPPTLQLYKFYCYVKSRDQHGNSSIPNLSVLQLRISIAKTLYDADCCTNSVESHW